MRLRSIALISVTAALGLAAAANAQTAGYAGAGPMPADPMAQSSPGYYPAPQQSPARNALPARMAPLSAPTGMPRYILVTTVSNAPIPDSREARAKYPPLSTAGRMTPICSHCYVG